MKAYVQKDTNDLTKIKVEFRSHTDINTITEAPKDANGNYITDKDVIVIKDMYIDPADNIEKDNAVIPAPSGVSTYKKAFVDSTLQANKDALLLQQTRDQKLELLRQKREEEFKHYEKIARHLTLGRRSDTAAVDSYYQSLLDLTNPYKDASGNATSAIDAFADDMSDFVMPTRI